MTTLPLVATLIMWPLVNVWAMHESLDVIALTVWLPSSKHMSAI